MSLFAHTSSGSSIGSQRHIFGLQRTDGEGYNSTILSPAEAAEKARIVTMRHAADLQLMPFAQAFEIWLDIHKEEIRERTYKDYLFYGRNLKKYFGDTLLSQIHIGHIVEYRKQRGAGAEIINHEIATLKQILKMAGLWDLIAKFYKPMRRPTWTPPKVLTEEQEERFFRVVAGQINHYHEKYKYRYHPWAVAYWASSFSSNTSAIGAELRSIQIKHMLLDHIPPKIHIPDDKVKNEFRARVIPLNEVALKQVKRLITRLEGIAGILRPDYYLFPFRIKKGEYDVNRPASAFFIRSAFRSMRTKTGLDWLQPRHFRNQIITKLFESGAPDETITSIAGHQAIKMSKYYSRIRLHAKAEALDKIAPKAVEKSKEGASDRKRG